VLLILTATSMGFYNYRVTGHPFLMPYQVHESTYGMVPVFLWQPLKTEQHYNHLLLGDLHKSWSCELYRYQQSFSGSLDKGIWKISTIWMFYIGILFTPFMAGLPWMWRRWRVKFALSICALMIAALLAETWVMPHYAAPATCLFFLLVVESLRQARFAKWHGKPVGKPLLGAILPLLLVSAIISFAVTQHLMPPRWQLERARMLRELEESRESHLILVSYARDHSPHCQWIYNHADIDTAKVVWAWEMGPQADKVLLDYFKERRVWLLRADQFPWHLVSYHSGSCKN
jgi:hypothetical protein